MAFQIRLAKENFKFSACHFTILSATEAERLHGHNYMVSVECGFCSLNELGMGIEFNLLKPIIKSLTQKWDERILIPKACPLVTVESVQVNSELHCQVDFQKKSYRFPMEDLVLLDVENVTTEVLARCFTEALINAWQPLAEKSIASRLLWIQTEIAETPGQSASFKKEHPFTGQSANEKPR